MDCSELVACIVCGEVFNKERTPHTCKRRECRTCRFWVSYECHRHAPVHVTETVCEGVGEGVLSHIEYRAVERTKWPRTHANDFCGEWEWNGEVPERAKEENVR